MRQRGQWLPLTARWGNSVKNGSPNYKFCLTSPACNNSFKQTASLHRAKAWCSALTVHMLNPWTPPCAIHLKHTIDAISHILNCNTQRCLRFQYVVWMEGRWRWTDVELLSQSASVWASTLQNIKSLLAWLSSPPGPVTHIHYIHTNPTNVITQPGLVK